MGSSLIGVAIACAGNVIISLALTIQKLAHRRQEEEHSQSRHESPSTSRSGSDEAVNATNGEGGEVEQLLSTHSDTEEQGDKDDTEEGVEEGQYLKSKLWWTGQALITLGEGGNFLSYAFAPASVVAPLGTVALIANCVFAPVILGERFMPRELIGMALAIVGAVTVVYASNDNNPRLTPDQLLHALLQLPFLIYTLLTVLLATLLALVSRSPAWGGRYIGIDVGVCCLFGGYTVLSTKALASLLSTMLFGAFRYPLSWLLVVVLVGTSVAQIKYLNKALMRFQSKEVIPTQFVFFSLAAIIGSAVLYQEFRDVPFAQFVNFAFGIATTFLGVYLLTSLSDSSQSPDAASSDTANSDTNAHSRPIRPLHSRGPSRTLTVHLPSVHERSPLLIPSRTPYTSHTSHGQSSHDRYRSQEQSLRSAPVGHASLGTGVGTSSGDGLSPSRARNITHNTGSEDLDTLTPIPSPRNPSNFPGSIGGLGSTGARLLKRSSTGSFTRVIGSQGGLLLLATPPGSVQRNAGIVGMGGTAGATEGGPVGRGRSGSAQSTKQGTSPA